MGAGGIDRVAGMVDGRRVVLRQPVTAVQRTIRRGVGINGWLRAVISGRGPRLAAGFTATRRPSAARAKLARTTAG